MKNERDLLGSVTWTGSEQVVVFKLPEVRNQGIKRGHDSLAREINFHLGCISKYREINSRSLV